MIEITDEMVRLASIAMNEHPYAPVRHALAAVAPLIEAQAREACAKVAETANSAEGAAALIRLSPRPTGDGR